MSRNLTRSIKRHQERQEQGLMKYAFAKYGHQVQLADLHPDIKMLFTLNLELADAANAGNAKTVAEAVDLIVEFMARYGGQADKVAKPVDSLPTGGV